MSDKDFPRYQSINSIETGKQIQCLMKDSHISPKQLQEYLGLTCVQSVYRWMNGNNLPSIDNLYAMSILFGTPIETIIVCADIRDNMSGSGQ